MCGVDAVPYTMCMASTLPSVLCAAGESRMLDVRRGYCAIQDMHACLVCDLDTVPYNMTWILCHTT